MGEKASFNVHFLSALLKQGENKMSKFKLGQSGNPSGRSKAAVNFQELAKEQTQTALGTLLEILHNEKAPPSARVLAASSLFARGIGKPAQYVESVNMNLTLNDYLAR